MVVIKRLIARGFKSFSNRTELVFGNGFNCIIGANGSGKTNLSDAVCFVLGKSSAHEMRAEKSANLIFNGGKKGSPAKEAEVTIEFDNSTGKFPINKKEVRITRVVKQNGTSIYKINEETRTRQQILELLNSAKLDPDGHNIVLQGDIVSLAEMKPIERRQVIEEISGISMYEDKKNKCLSELEKVDVKLNEAEIILTEREVNLRELKKERDQAIKYKDLQESVKDHKATLVHLQIKEKEEKLNEIEKRKKEAEEKTEKINKEIDSVRQLIQNNKEQINTINNEVEVKGEKDQLIIRKEIEELKTEIVKANSRLEVCQSEIVKIKSRKEQLNNNIKEVEDKIKELKLKKQEQEKNLKDINNEEKELQKQLELFKEKHGVDTDINKSLEEIDENIDNLLSKLNKINEEKQNVIRTKDQIQFKLNSIEERLNALKGSGKELEDLKRNKKELKEINENLSKAVNEDSSYSLQLNKLRQEFSNSTEELAKQRSRQIGIQERNLNDSAVRKILELKSTIKGINGTVASLGEIETKYALALEVAAGSRLSSIVVDSEITAQKCIEHLKINRLGVATFLPLNKIKSRIVEQGIKEILNQKGVHGLAVDLVKYDQKYKDVFSYTLGSTLVIDNIETGRRIGIGRARMVTTEGDLLEPSGAMIGGYRMQKTGLGFKEKELNENVENLEEEINKKKTLINHIENKKLSNEDIIRKLREKRANLEADVIKLEKSLNIDTDTSNLIENKKDLLDEQKKLDKELSETESKIKQFSKELENSKVKKQKLKEKIADPNLSNNLEKLEDNKLKIKEKILEIIGNIKNIDTQIESMLAPEREKTEKIIKQQDREYDDFIKELNNVKDLTKKREQELKTKEQEEKKFYSNFKDLINKRNKLLEKIQSLETDIARESEKLKGNDQRLNNVNIDRAKAVAELEALQKEFEPFKEAKIKRGLSIEELKLKIREDEKELNSIGNVNLRALEVYEQIQEEYEKVIDKVKKLKLEKEDVLKMMSEIESKKKDIFMKTYNIIVKNFKDIFNQLTTKGEAHIELENQENPFEAGVDIQVRITGNKLLDIRSLSGGEKTMAALAFIFAIQEYDPSPFYLLDEVDAALDKRNSELLSKLIQKYADKAQYIVISHNDNIISEANYIYGVSMQDNVSKIVSLKV
ncbi:chromosome segregation protein SMC [Candidatus Woesearchaeota archaeon]|nr:chromosome segregation protein SMC [Candidatus Woesearchaeota archaeon]